MVKKLNLPILHQKLKNKGLLVFSPFDVQKHFSISSSACSKFLSRNTQKGYLVKLKNGLYQFPQDNLAEEFIANKVYRPSYVSLEYALSFYGIIPETVYEVTSTTTKPSREFIINNISYSYHKIKKQAFTGYVGKRQASVEYLIAEPEKALVDWLYFVDLGRRKIQDRLEVRDLSLDKMFKYGNLFGRDSLNRLIKKTYDFSRRNKKIVY